jgi:CRISPR-associated protein Csh2
MDSNKPRMDVATGVYLVLSRLNRNYSRYLAEKKRRRAFVSGDPITSEKRASLLITDLKVNPTIKKRLKSIKLLNREGMKASS